MIHGEKKCSCVKRPCATDCSAAKGATDVCSTVIHCQLSSARMVTARKGGGVSRSRRKYGLAAQREVSLVAPTVPVPTSRTFEIQWLMREKTESSIRQPLNTFLIDLAYNHSRPKADYNYFERANQSLFFSRLRISLAGYRASATSDPILRIKG